MGQEPKIKIYVGQQIIMEISLTHEQAGKKGQKTEKAEGNPRKIPVHGVRRLESGGHRPSLTARRLVRCG
jgi:hypothetical protein